MALMDRRWGQDCPQMFGAVSKTDRDSSERIHLCLKASAPSSAPFIRTKVDAILGGNEQDRHMCACDRGDFVHCRNPHFTSGRHSAERTTRTAVVKLHPRDVLVQRADHCLSSAAIDQHPAGKRRCTMPATSFT